VLLLPITGGLLAVDSVWGRRWLWYGWTLDLLTCRECRLQLDSKVLHSVHPQCRTVCLLLYETLASHWASVGSGR